MDSTAQPPSHDPILELNFVPTWARKPPGHNPYARFEGPTDRRDRRDESRGRRPPFEQRSRAPGDRRERGDRGGRDDRQRREMRGRPRPRDAAETAPEDRRRRSDGPAGFPAPPPPLPVEVAFIPTRDSLTAVVREIQTTGRAFPLIELAAGILSRPDRYLVRLGTRRAPAEAPALHLYQCRACQAVFPEREAALAHATAAHLETRYTREDVVDDPPAGHFSFVGRCRLGGELLGPPNYHTYNERLRDLHRTRYPHMAFEAFQAQIENVRDPDLIEQWKEEMRHRTVYRRIDQTDAEALPLAAATAEFREKAAPGLIKESPRVIVTPDAARQTEDPRLRRTLEEAWAKESRFPLTLSLALRPAFRHMRLHLFKAGGDRPITFVTRISPRPVDPARTIESIREVLQYLHEHPGSTRHGLVSDLRPGLAPDSPEAAAVLSPLRWLIDRGHVVEFFDGTLAVPRSSGRGRRPERAG